MVESWLGSVLYVVAASRDELGQLSSVSWSSSPPLNTENMLEVSTFAGVVVVDRKFGCGWFLHFCCGRCLLLG